MAHVIQQCFILFSPPPWLHRQCEWSGGRHTFSPPTSYLVNVQKTALSHNAMQYNFLRRILNYGCSYMSVRRALNRRVQGIVLVSSVSPTTTIVLHRSQYYHKEC